MPSVRTAKAPTIAPKISARNSAIGNASHHDQPMLIAGTPFTPKIATMYPAKPAIVICARLTIPP